MQEDRFPGTCFGFAVQSSLPFRFLRGGGGEPLDIAASSSDGEAEEEEEGELLVKWSPTAERPFEVRLFRTERGYRVWIPDSGWYGVNVDAGSVTVPADADEAAALAAAKGSEKVRRLLREQPEVRVVVRPPRLVNFVTKGS